MSELRADFTALEDAMAGINTTVPRYAMVSNVEEKLTGIYIDVSVYGDGDYPIVVSLYGSELDPDKISVKPFSGCGIRKIYAYGDYALVPFPIDLSSCNCTEQVWGYNLSSNYTQLAVVISPDDSWDAVDLIQLKVKKGGGTVSYATAIVAESWTKAVEEW